MALVHDLAEAQSVVWAYASLLLELTRNRSVGDITPVEGVTPQMKHQVGRSSHAARPDPRLTTRSSRPRLCRPSWMRCWEERAAAMPGSGYRRCGRWVGRGLRDGRAAEWLCRQEYETRETPEAKFVKDLDRIELILQAIVSWLSGKGGSAC